MITYVLQSELCSPYTNGTKYLVELWISGLAPNTYLYFSIEFFLFESGLEITEVSCICCI